MIRQICLFGLGMTLCLSFCSSPLAAQTIEGAPADLWLMSFGPGARGSIVNREFKPNGSTIRAGHFDGNEIVTLVFLLAGQSNAQGRGTPRISGTDDAVNRINTWNASSQTIGPASEPLPHRGSFPNPAFIGPWLAFAKELLPTLPSNYEILLVPMAAPSTNFQSGYWRKGGDGRELAITETNAAVEAVGDNVIFGGTLWHQGESDAYNGSNVQHTAELIDLVDDLRERIDAADLETPFVLGDLATTFATVGHLEIREAISRLRTLRNNISYVPSVGLTADDGTHFNAPSARTLGQRYVVSYLKALDNADTYESKLDQEWFFGLGNSLNDSISDLQAPLITTATFSDDPSNVAGVFVFQLPDVGDTPNPFTSANFEFNYNGPDSRAPAPTYNADLYGMNRRSSSTSILEIDYFVGPQDAGVNATLLRDNILSPTSSPGFQSVSIVDFLNAQYASGAGAGDFIFLRFSPDFNPDSPIQPIRDGYLMASANVSDVDLRPRIEFFLESSVRLGDVNKDGVVNFLDITPFISFISSGDFKAEADIDGNGTVNFLDVASFIAILTAS